MDQSTHKLLEEILARSRAEFTPDSLPADASRLRGTHLEVVALFRAFAGNEICFFDEELRRLYTTESLRLAKKLYITNQTEPVYSDLFDRLQGCIMFSSTNMRIDIPKLGTLSDFGVVNGVTTKRVYDQFTFANLFNGPEPERIELYTK